MKTDKSSDKTLDCVDWLRKRLEGKDAILCDTIRAEGKAQGFKKAEMKAARAILGVKTFHQPDAEWNWFWYLPEEVENA